MSFVHRTRVLVCSRTTQTFRFLHIDGRDDLLWASITSSSEATHITRHASCEKKLDLRFHGLHHAYFMNQSKRAERSSAVADEALSGPMSANITKGSSGEQEEQ